MWMTDYNSSEFVFHARLPKGHHLRLLREHGIIRKLPRQHKYQLTLKGVKLTNMLNAFLAASTEKLMKMAA